LHSLTQKDVAFQWSSECEEAFKQLKTALVNSPVLVYPNFLKPFTLETDASIKGLGAILSQLQDDHRLHPVAYASRSLSTTEKQYGITELETLAVVWTISHFHAYLYGNDVTVYTDHSAVKAVLETPSPSAKHVRWWTQVYASGVRNVKIVYHCGKENVIADALSHSDSTSSPDTDIQDQIAIVEGTPLVDNMDISTLLNVDNASDSNPPTFAGTDLSQAQKDDPALQ